MTAILLRLSAEQRAWVKALPQDALAMVEAKVAVRGQDWLVQNFESVKAQMDYVRDFL
ncbi:MAG: hypothetical protein ACLPV8_01305 [Steroidobacteraceae bacterium]